MTADNHLRPYPFADRGVVFLSPAVFLIASMHEKKGIPTALKKTLIKSLRFRRTRQVQFAFCGGASISIVRKYIEQQTPH